MLKQILKRHSFRQQKFNLTNQFLQSYLQKEQINFADDEDFEVIVNILSKENKSKLEAEVIQKAFQSFKFFQELEMDQDQLLGIYKSLIKCIQLWRHRKKILYNSEGNCVELYKVLIQNKDKQNEQQEVERKDSKKYKKKKEQLQAEVQDGEQVKQILLIYEQEDLLKYIDCTDDEFLEQRYPDFIKVASIGAGKSFGELAITKGEPRAATIVCAEYTHFVTLTRDIFNKFLSVYYQKEQEKNIEFLKSISILNQWNDLQLQSLYYLMQLKEYQMNQVIYKEGDQIKYTHFTLNIIVTSTLFSREKSKYQNQSIFSIQEKDLTQISQKFISRQRRMRVSLLGRGQVFGYDDIINQKNKRTTLAYCSSGKVRMFILEKEKFESQCKKDVTLLKLQGFYDQQQNLISQNTSTILKYESPDFLRDPPKDKLFQGSQLYIQKEKFIDKEISCDNIKNMKNSLRVSNKGQNNSCVQKLEENVHKNLKIDNFEKKLNQIQKIVGSSEELSLGNKAYFDLSTNKTEALNIMRQIFPGSQRPTYEIPKNYGKKQLHLIRCLKLPKVLSKSHSKTKNSQYQFAKGMKTDVGEY